MEPLGFDWAAGGHLGVQSWAAWVPSGRADGAGLHSGHLGLQWVVLCPA